MSRAKNKNSAPPGNATDQPGKGASFTPRYDADHILRVGVAMLSAMVILALYPFSRDPAVDTKIVLYAWGAAILTLGLFASRFLAKRPLIRPRLLLLPLSILFGWFVVTGLLSDYVANSIAEITKFIPLLLLYFVASQLYQKPEHLHGLIATICGAVSLSIVYGVFQHFGIDPFPWEPSLRAALSKAPGTFGNGNLAAHATVLCIVMAAYGVGSRMRFRYLYLALILLLLVHLELATQRGGVVGLLAALVLVSAAGFFHRRTRKPLRAIVAGFGTLALAGLIAAGGIMTYKYIRTGVPYPTGLSILLRYNGYYGATRLIAQKPLLGYGPGNYRTENPQFWTPFEQEHFVVEHRMNYNVHNDALEIGVEAGLPAAGLYLTLLITAIAAGLWITLTSADPGRRKLGLMFAGLFCTFLVDGLFGFNLRAPISAMLLFLFLGALEGTWFAESVASGYLECGVCSPLWLDSQGDPRFQPKRRTDAALQSSLGKGELPAWSAAPVLIAVALVALAAMAVIIQTMRFEAGILFLRGRGDMAYKAFPEADQEFAAGQSLTPWDWEFAFQRGENAHMRYDAPTALSHYERAGQQNPYFPPVYDAMARCEVMIAEVNMRDRPLAERLRVLDSADKHAARALELCRVFPEAEDTAGRALALRATLLQAAPAPNADQIKDYWRRAEAHFLRAIDLDIPEKDRTYQMLARTRNALGNPAGAREAFMRAIDVNPGNTAAWGLLYRSIQSAGAAQSAGQEKLYRELLERGVARLEKESKEIPAALAALHLSWDKQAGGPEKAAAFLAETARNRVEKRTAAPVNDDFSWAAGVLLDELTRSGAPPQQIAPALCNLAIMYATLKDWPQANALFERGVKDLSGANLVGGAQAWAQVLLDTHKPDKAVDMLHEVIGRGVRDANLQLTLARCLAKCSRFAEARTEYENLLKSYSLDEKSRQKVQQELDGLARK